MIAAAIALTLVALLWAATSISDSYAAAQQAKAAIATAQAAQTASAGNAIAITVLSTLLIVVVAGALTAMVLSARARNAPGRRPGQRQARQFSPTKSGALPAPSDDPLERLTRLMTLRMMQEFRQEPPRPQRRIETPIEE